MDGSGDKDGLTDLFSQLCQLQLRDRKRAYFVQPCESKDHLKGKLRKRLYDTLFTFLNSQHGSKSRSPENCAHRERILAYSLSLRLQRKFDEASRLEDLMVEVTNHKDDKITAMIQLLSLLIGSSENKEKSTIGHLGSKLPVIFGDKATSTILPNGPKEYGDSCLMKPGDPFFMHYPRDLFENGALFPDLQINTLCDQTPGQGLSGNGFFSVQGLLNDPYEKNTRTSLFGALVQSHVTSLDVRLDLPEVTDETDNKMFELKPPKYHDNADDEGFVSVSAVSTSTESQCDSESGGLDIWDLALNYTPSHHYTWETIGQVPGPTERPYLTEAGPEAVAEIYDQWQRELSIICDEAGLVRRSEISQTQLVKDVINLLIGIPSRSFRFEEKADKFVIRTGLSFHGLTPDALSEFVPEFIRCGSQFHRLCGFSQPPVLDSFYKKGLVFQAFTDAIRKYLQYYRAAVLSLPKDKTIFEIKLLCFRIVEQMRFVANLCQCADPSTGKTELLPFPNGVALLSYLYKECLAAINTDHYTVMLSLLQTAVAPYCMFIQDWVYHGIYRDVYGEFMFEVNTDFLQYRDKHYWTRGFSLKSHATEENVPSFLSHLAEEIFTCGKAINLLKLCNPKHFLCNVEDRETPRVRIAFGQDDLDSLWSQCQVYVSRMQQIARQVVISRDVMKRRAEQAKIELMERAKEASMKDIARYQAKVAAYRKAVDTKKRKEFKELKQQMEKDLKRRAAERTKEKSDDKEFMDRLTKREEMMDRREAELELQARAELIEMYSKLTEEAAQRERKALWRIERAKLATTRLDFLVQQEVEWRKELQERYQTQEETGAVDTDDGGELPGWAERASEGGTVVVAAQTPDEPTDVPSVEPIAVSKSPQRDDATLPSWAERRIRNTDTRPATLQVKTDDLPAWALKRLESDQNVVVQDNGSPVEEENESSHLSEDFQAGDSQTLLKNTSTTVELKGSTTSESDNGQNKQRARFPSSPSKWKPHVKVVGDIYAETHEQPERPNIQIKADKNATAESVEPTDTEKLSVKRVGDNQVGAESESIVEIKSTVHFNPNMHSTMESVSEDSKPHIRTCGLKNVNEESESSSEQFVPHLKQQAGKHATDESAPVQQNVKKSSVYGHISQLSNMEFVISAPKLKRPKGLHIGVESDFKSFAIKPNIRMSEKMSATQESTEVLGTRSGVRMSSHMHASKESERVDVDAERVNRFKQRNLYGHSSDSTVQKLLYGDKFGKGDVQDGDVKDIDSGMTTKEPLYEKLDLHLVTIPVEPYPDEFVFLGDNPSVDLLSTVLGREAGRFGEWGVGESHQYTPLAVLLRTSVTLPLLAQISLVNDCVLGYFVGELQIDEHFQALRRYLLMGDGDFAQILSDMLFEKLAVAAAPREILNPVFLHGALTRSVRSSMHADDKYADSMSFALKYSPLVLNQSAPTCLDCLELQYKVDWPLNIVITDNCLNKYSKVFSYMLQLRRLVWVLKDVWYKLKGDAVILKAANSSQFRQLQLFRQEMQHFVKVMQGYIANQIIHVTWQEFQQALNQDVHNLDQLHRVHAEYLDMAIFRCLLNKKAEPVMRIIQNIFCLILKFRNQLISASWQKSSTTREARHPNFNAMVHSYKVFREHSSFLFTVVNKLDTRGYQPHLHELLLRLNFNDYYTNRD